MGAADAGCDRRRASVRRLHVAHIEVVVAEHRAAYRRRPDGAVLQPEFVQGFGDQLMDNAMAAARTVMRLVLVFVLALKAIVENWGFGMNNSYSITSCFLSAYANARCVSSLRISSTEGTLPPYRP